MLGTSIEDKGTENNTQRKLCTCYGGKVDALQYNKNCASHCVYCYAKHENDKALEYYNEDGTLKDNNFTRTRYSQPTQIQQQPQQKEIQLSTTGYKKEDPQKNPNIDYVFTENAEAYVVSNKVVLDKIPDFPNQGKTKLGVSDVGGTNQAGIRNTQYGTTIVKGVQVENPKAYDPAYNNPNAYGIVVKKYQQDANGRFVAKEGQFKDTNEDFDLFVKLNEDMFKRLSESSNKQIVFPTQMGLSKAALPKRFAEWLQAKLLEKFDIQSTIEKNTRADYDGYGLKLNSINQKRLQQSQTQQQPEQNITSTANDYVMQSGGAYGADTVWGRIASEFGINNQNHWYSGERGAYNAPNGNIKISQEDYNEGSSKVAEAAKMNWGYQYDTMKDDRLIRNWAQVKYADAVFAVGHLVGKGGKVFPNKANDNRVAETTVVQGGTGYAVSMAILEGKPVYMFDQIREKWAANIDGVWQWLTEAPVLTKKFAGIGTRNINAAGEQAIRDVFEKTFGDKNEQIPEEQRMTEAEREEAENNKKMCEGE